MAPQQALAILHDVWLFSDVPHKDLLALAQTTNQRKIAKGDVVVSYGDPEADLYIIRSGHFTVSVPTPDGKELVLNLLGAKEFFGELSLLDGRPRSASVTCIEPGEVLIVHRAEFLALLRRSTETSIKLLQNLASLVRKLSVHAEEHATHGLKERLAKQLLLLSERCGTRLSANQIALRIPFAQKELGALVHGSRESVNKCLGKWEDEGIISKAGRRLVIRDRARLEAEAQAHEPA